MQPNHMTSDCFEKLKQKFEYLFEAPLLEEMCQYGSLKTIAPDKELIDIGMEITHMPVILEGSIKIMTEDDQGDELLLYYLEFGDTCAVTLNCCTKKTKSTIRAISETEVNVIMVPVDRMEIWMAKYKTWRNYVLDSYNSRLSEMLSAIDNIVFNSLEDRLKKYLKDKAWVTKNAVLKISHKDIANDLHSSRVVISRLMKKLEKDKIISQKRNEIIFLEFDS